MKLLAAFVRAAALASRRRSATSMAAIEVERKYAALCAGDELRERLAAAGGNLQSELAFRDTYFDGDVPLTRADTWLRRRERAGAQVPFAEGGRAAAARRRRSARSRRARRRGRAARRRARPRPPPRREAEADEAGAADAADAADARRGGRASSRARCVSRRSRRS